MTLADTLLLVLISLLSSLNATTTMMIVWGRPSSLANAQLNKTLSWEQCVDSCFSSPTCVLAYQNTTGCNLFLYNGVSTVLQGTEINQTVVAFKVDVANDTCPVGKNPPTFDNAIANGNLYVPTSTFPIKVFYNVSLSGTTWKFTYKSVVSCPSTFSYLNTRPDGNDQCVAIFFDLYKNSTRGFNVTFSKSSCASASAVLPAIHFPIDAGVYPWLIRYIVGLGKLKSSNVTVRIGGVRTAACRADPTNSTCMTPAGFQFDDTVPKDFTNYVWLTDSSARSNSDADCLVYVVDGTNSTMKVDVQSCTTKSTQQAYGFLCVKPAWT